LLNDYKYKKPYENQDGNPHRALSQRQYKAISECLSDLADKLRISAVLLVDGTGRVMSHKIRSGHRWDATLLSTLAANTYAAAKELARLIGEKDNFRMVLHEGLNQSLFVASVRADFFLVVIFESGVALGMVRLFTKKTLTQLDPILAQKETESLSFHQVIDDRFQSQLDAELDRSLRERT
jgi:predicted regulator of Ras-like GTPase activity (Roadblock/LC7/MglB family)